MATMLNGAAVMDAALLLIAGAICCMSLVLAALVVKPAFVVVAGNETCPQPQTSEHLAAVEIMKLDNIIILQNKIDLVTETDAVGQHKQIKQFVKGTVAENAPIVPISAQLEHNVDLVCHHIVTHIPVPVRPHRNYCASCDSMPQFSSASSRNVMMVV